MKPPPIEFAACTIIAKNYLPMARVLAESWHRFHRGAPIFVLLLDSAKGFFFPEAEEFRTVLISELEIPNLAGFLFKYSVMEASTAAKPYFLHHLLEKHSIQKLLYLDPDIQILNSLEPLIDSLDDCNILLTPHLTTPLPRDGCNPSDHTILQAGTYNLGFIGLRAGKTACALLDWWCEKLYHECIVSFERNLFVDQRWMDLVPGLFEGVRVWRDAAYNIAYWNLHERQVSVKGDEITVDNVPVRFFHFSGFNPDYPNQISKHQNRFRKTSDAGDVRHLYARYRERLLSNGWSETKRWKYDHDTFDNGVSIPPAARRYYWDLGPGVHHLGDPFTWLDEASGVGSNNSGHAKKVARLAFGVNVLGYLNSEKGVGEGVRSNLRIVRAARIPYVANNTVDSGSQNIESLPVPMSVENPYAVNLMTVNADQFAAFARSHPTYTRGHYNVGYWAWELPEFPPEWLESFEYADEIWTPSQFTHDSVASVSPLPVRVLPHCIDFDLDGISFVKRSRFGLDGEVFIFLFFFDFHSFLERKNPLGLIQAYKQAFGPRKDVQLLIKSAHSLQHKSELQLLQQASLGANVRILDGVFSREEKHQLMLVCDCYISLHRSEGFGLTMAEAMFCGKPVIATGYSGNVDFMTPETSFLVPCQLITLDRTHGPYREGYHWAQPDLSYAIDVMRYVEKDRGRASAMGANGSKHVRRVLAPTAIARTLIERMQKLGLGKLGDSLDWLDAEASDSPIEANANTADFVRRDDAVADLRL